MSGPSCMECGERPQHRNNSAKYCGDCAVIVTRRKALDRWHRMSERQGIPSPATEGQERAGNNVEACAGGGAWRGSSC